MSKRIHDLSPERAATQNRVQDLHALYMRLGAYTRTQQERITFHWIEEFSWLPKPIRPLFKQRRSLQGPHFVVVLARDASKVPTILMVLDDREAGTPVGAIALYDEKTKDYNAFDFERGSSDDYHIVKPAVKYALQNASEQWKDAPKIFSSPEWEHENTEGPQERP